MSQHLYVYISFLQDINLENQHPRSRQAQRIIDRAVCHTNDYKSQKSGI